VEAEELGVLMLMGYTFVGVLGFDEHDEVAIGAAEDFA
jgi:hypothetical protein